MTVKLRVPKAIRRSLYWIATTILWRDSRPSSMYARKRSAPRVYLNEYMFFRWWGDNFEDGMPRPANVAVPDQSANRSSTGGRFWTVLLPDPGVTDREQIERQIFQAVLRHRASDQTMTVTVDDVKFSFQFEPDVLDYNYHHCELRVYRDGERLFKADAKKLKGAEKSMWKRAEKEFRDNVSKLYRVNRIDPVFLTAEIAQKGKDIASH